jgi:hypothetical protein
MKLWLTASLALVLGICPVRTVQAEVRGATVGIDTTCPYGLLA